MSIALFWLISPFRALDFASGAAGGIPELDIPLIQVCFGLFSLLLAGGKCSLLVPTLLVSNEGVGHSYAIRYKCARADPSIIKK